jgi:hypothetical protein
MAASPRGDVCDGHGDLQAEDIFCLDDGVRILDCIEFSDQLRYGDVCADVAFLAMDLERLGRPDAAERFVFDYESQAGQWTSRGRSCTTTSPSAPTSGRRWPACSPSRGSRAVIAPPASCMRWPCATCAGPAGAGAGGRPPWHREEHAGGRTGRRDRVGAAALGRGPSGIATTRRTGEVRETVDAGCPDAGRYAPVKPSRAVYDELVRRAQPAPQRGRVGHPRCIVDRCRAQREASAASGRRQRQRGHGALLHLRRTRWRQRADSTSTVDQRHPRIRGHAAQSESHHGREDGCVAIGHHDRHLRAALPPNAARWPSNSSPAERPSASGPRRPLAYVSRPRHGQMDVGGTR